MANPKLRDAEHLAAHLIDDRNKAKPLAPTPAIGAPAPSGLPGLKTMQAIPMAGPSNSDLFSLGQALHLQLKNWQPKTPAQRTLQKDLGPEVNALNDVLFQQSLEKQIADEEAVSLTSRISISDTMAPNLEKLHDDLEALGDEPLPPALASALGNFQAEFDRCFPAEAPVHPKSPAEQQAAHPHLSFKPEPTED